MAIEPGLDVSLSLLAESDWLGQRVTDLAGQHGVVRRVYQVHTVQVAILTAIAAAPDVCPIWDAPLDLLARGDEQARLPDFQQQSEEVGRLEYRVLHGSASQAERERYRVLRDRLAPYRRAGDALHSALIAQIRAGDRVIDFIANWQGTVLDPDPLPPALLPAQDDRPP
ncbi:hypothetical protein SMD44_p10204 (plasmid) [Streptomyces alboflavus]|uniref:Uncharacterized protein n=1 Tax=Streptomyces alboflavus TaxID=67267 RepID=A0A291W474_9ACTN|nr:hypothetical protein [Streptomyces alboflavus]ATM24703.1 hypothetical protein SMD44_p10204 [Streptomyces alboflavus]